jgi:hypothetical protein
MDEGHRARCGARRAGAAMAMVLGLMQTARADREAASEQAQRAARQAKAERSGASIDGVPTRPTAPRLVDRPTAVMPSAYAMAGVNHRGELMAALEVGFGEIAAAGVGYDDRLLTGATIEDAVAQGRVNAWFRMGVEARRWSRHQPAMDLTFERTNGEGEAQAAELRAGATQSWRSSFFGVFDASAGVGLWELHGDDQRLSERGLAERVRPFGGLAWTPASYPNTSLLVEGSFGPRVIEGEPQLDWRLGWGARYQVVSWGTIDLVVRNRQEAGLAGSTVMVRLAALVR